MSAIFPPCGRFRYSLTREISMLGVGTALWLMLNPSKAGVANNDPTIVRVIRFSIRLGFARAVVGNLFALRSTNPRHLQIVGDPVGPENDAHILRMAGEADRIILAYGADPFAQVRAVQVRALLSGKELWCLGKTRAGGPRHPLYLRADSELVPA